MHRGRASHTGQASVETVAMVPLIALVVVALIWAFATGVLWLSAGVGAWSSARRAAIDPASPRVVQQGVFRVRVTTAGDGLARAQAAARVRAPWGPPLDVDVAAEAASR